MIISSITGLPMPPPVAAMQPVRDMPLPMSYEDFRKDHPMSVEVEKIEEEQHNLSWPQYFFVTTEAKFPAMVAGYGAGKTEAGVIRALKLKMDAPKLNVGYYLPTYDLIKQIVFPRMEELLTQHGYGYFLNETAKELIIYGMPGKIIFRTMDNPASIIGYQHAHAIADELDTLKTDKAAEVWRKIVARNRQRIPGKGINTIGVATTPEGFRFTYQKWKQNPLKGSQIIKASTYSNAHNLPDDYIETLKDNFPEQMLEAYLNGEFVNLTQGSVYVEFDRKVHNTDRAVKEQDKVIHVGMDFNVGKMAAAVFVIEDNKAYAVDEFTDYLDTPAIIKAIKARYPDKIVFVYPDASGGSRKTQNASESDIALLEAAGFNVQAEKKNPFVRDRVLSVNIKLKKREMFVNVTKCPVLTEALEQQAYNDKGEPDKQTGHDHINDAMGYFICFKFPVANYGVLNMKVLGV